MAVSTWIYSTLYQGFAARVAAAVTIVGTIKLIPLINFLNSSQNQLRPKSQWHHAIFRHRLPKSNPSIGLLQPLGDARHRFTHFVSRTRVGKTDELAAMNGIEIDAGGRCDMGLFQHRAGEFETVIGEIRNIGVKVKRAIRR